jgi:hypothetical protein
MTPMTNLIPRPPYLCGSTSAEILSKLRIQRTPALPRPGFFLPLKQNHGSERRNRGNDAHCSKSEWLRGEARD